MSASGGTPAAAAVLDPMNSDIIRLSCGQGACSGPITIVENLTGVSVGDTVNHILTPMGGTANGRLGVAGTLDSCDFVAVVITVRGGPIASSAVVSVQITANYVPAGVSNLTNVTALDAIFICVNAAATYRLT